jgi:ankyrin repeat protein
MKFRQAYDMVVNESVFRPPSDDEIWKRHEKDVNPLVKAIKDKNIPLFNALLKRPGVDVNEVDEKSYEKPTPLIIAVDKYYNYYLSRLLAAPGIDVNKTDADGYTPLMCAVDGRKYDIAMKLLKHPGIDVNMVLPRLGITALDYVGKNNAVGLLPMDKEESEDMDICEEALLEKGAKKGSELK